MATILDGRKVRDSLIPDLIKKIQGFPNLTLAIIQVGNRPDSSAFIRAKKEFANKLGVKIKHIRLDDSVTYEELAQEIKKNNEDKTISGIVLQLPLPASIDSKKIIELIDPKKDVDAITSQNVKFWMSGKSGSLFPATARGIRELLKYYSIELNDKKVTVVGRSDLVGKPIIEMCRSQGANVTICHSKTIDLPKETKKADILIVAVGKAKLIQAKHVKRGQTVIDVGISKERERLVGDVDFNEVEKIVSKISPVPGGVGPMTVCGLFENLVSLAKE